MTPEKEQWKKTNLEITKKLEEKYKTKSKKEICGKKTKNEDIQN